MFNITKRKKSTIIDDKEFEIYLLRMDKGLVVAQELVNLILPVLGGAVDKLPEDGEGIELAGGFGEVATTLVTQLGKLNVNELVGSLLKELTVNGQQVDLNEYFAANYGELLEILEFALRENFQSFFTAKALLTRLTGAAADKGLMKTS